MKTKPYWIKERHNPQLGVYYVACGQMSRTAAKQQEGGVYGRNYMHPYDTESTYQARLTELSEKGEKVQ